MPLTRSVKGIPSLKGFSLPSGQAIEEAKANADKDALIQMQNHVDLAVRTEDAQDTLDACKAEVAATKSVATRIEQAIMLVSCRLGITLNALLKWRSDKAEDRAYTKRSVEDAVSRYGSDMPHYDDGDCVTSEVPSSFTATDVKELINKLSHDFIVEGVDFEIIREEIKMVRAVRKESGHAEGVKSLERISERIKTHGDVVMTHSYKESRNGTIRESSTATYNRPLPKGPAIKEKTNVKAVEVRIADAIASLV